MIFYSLKIYSRKNLNEKKTKIKSNEGKKAARVMSNND